MSMSAPGMGNSRASIIGLSLPAWLGRWQLQALVVALLSVGVYVNTWRHEFALDDAVVINQNQYVLEGVQGLPDIFTKDGYESYFRYMNTTNQLSGGRYRPLSIATFALEQQFFGALPPTAADSVIRQGMQYDMQSPYEQQYLRHMRVRHVVNVLLYGLSMVVLLVMLRQVMVPGSPAVAFLATVLFALHPIHTEVVANVKSRDEVLSLLFICATFIFAYKHVVQRGIANLLIGLVCFALALLSKEYGLVLVGLLPLSFWLTGGATVRRAAVATVPYLAVALLYLAIRYMVLPSGQNELADMDIQINPYAYATHTEQLATELATMLHYPRLLLWPHPLTSDYSYNQIPYKDFSHPMVWMSILVHLAMLGGLLWLVAKRHWLALPLALYLACLLMVCNLVFPIGATMGERLIYHASLGFCVLAAYGLCWVVGHIPHGGKVLAGLAVVVAGLYAAKTVARNADWKNNETLYLADIHNSPNSFLLNVNVAAILVNKSDREPDETKRNAQLQAALPMFDKVIAMQSTYLLAYVNKAIAYIKMNNADSAEASLDKLQHLMPTYFQLPELYYYTGMTHQYWKEYAKAGRALTKCLAAAPAYAPAQQQLRAIDSLLAAQDTLRQ